MVYWNSSFLSHQFKLRTIKKINDSSGPPTIILQIITIYAFSTEQSLVMILGCLECYYCLSSLFYTIFTSNQHWKYFHWHITILKS